MSTYREEETGREGGTRREDARPDDGLTRRESGAFGSGAPVQADGATRRETAGGTGDGYTRREDRAGQVPSQRPPGSGQMPFIRGLPPELSGQFSVTEELAAGAEADVVVADDVTTGERVVIKLYRRGIAPDEQAVRRLATADQDHVVRVLRSGWASGNWFDVLEYCPIGSLRTLMDSDLPPDTLDVVREVSSALAHVHQLGIVHRDLKPENILIRTVTPALDLVLGDFGLVRAVDASVRWTRAWGTPAYSPPEFEGGELSAAWDWWGLGMIIAELAGGRHPFQLPDGAMMNDQQIRAALAQRPVDLSAIASDRIRLLCQGLLTRDRLKRWNEQQVDQWLAGGSPAVVADAAAGIGRVRQVLFDGREYDNTADLAAALQQSWTAGLRALYQERDAALAEDLIRMLRQHSLDEALQLAQPTTDPRSVPRRYASLLSEMDPELAPVYNGIRLTPAGLEAAGAEVTVRPGAGGPGAVLVEVLEQRILTCWRALPGMDRGPEIERAWAAAAAQLDSGLQALGRHGYQPDDMQRALGRAWLLLCILADSHESELTAQIGSLDIKAAGQQSWWQEIYSSAASSGPVPRVIALLSQPVAAEQTHRQQQAERDRREAEQTARRSAREADRQRQSAAARRGDRTLVRIAIFLMVTVGAPYGLGVLWHKQLSHPSIPPPPNIHALPVGSTFVPELVFGLLVILGVLGLTLVRPPYRGRVGHAVAGLVLIGAGLGAVSAANLAVTDFNQAGQHRYATGPIAISALDGQCGTYWTSNGPVGTGYNRWVLTDDSTTSGQCQTLALYHGWSRAWHIHLEPNRWWASLHLYGNVAVVEKDVSGRPNVLEGYLASTGKHLWTFSCHDGNAEYVSDTSYGSSDITASCARGQVTISPSTGRQVR